MSQRPTLKLKLTTAPPPSSRGSTPTPSTAIPKLKLKLGSAPKPPQDSSAPPPTLPKTKAGRKPKTDKPRRISQPTSKKRDLEASIQSDDEDEGGPSASNSAPLANVKRIKLNTRSPSTPFIRLKGRGRPPVRPYGVGYDSEASDREEDPAIEEEFMLRMTPGPDCDYLRQAVQERRFGPRSEGGADVRMRFLDTDGRRAVVTIQGRHYAATMVDLPCIIEAMKSWDRRGWWKTADICQMLLVLGRVEKEEDANHYPLPTRDLDVKTWQYAHGLTPPMHWVRRRRFRKRASKPAIEEVEDKVEELLRKDDECEESHCQMVDEDQLRVEESRRASSEAQGGHNMLSNAGMQEDGLEYGSQDAEGDLDDSAGYYDTGGVAAAGNTEDADDGLEADLEQAMMMECSDVAGTPDSAAPAAGQASHLPTGANNNATNASAPVIMPSLSQAQMSGARNNNNVEYTSGEDADAAADEDEDDDDEEEDDDEELDEDALEQQQELQRQREEIADLEAAIRGQETELERLQNPILKQKLGKKIQSLRADLALKRAAIGEDAGDD